MPFTTKTYSIMRQKNINMSVLNLSLLRILLPLLFRTVIPGVLRYKVGSELACSVFWPRCLEIKALSCFTVCELELVLENFLASVSSRQLGRCLRAVRRNYCLSRKGVVRILELIREGFVNKSLRSRRFLDEKAKILLGRRPIRAVAGFSTEFVDRGTSQLYKSSPEYMRLLCRFLDCLDIKVSGVLSDICCGNDESIILKYARAFPDLRGVVLNDFYGWCKYRLDVRLSGNMRWLTEGADWVVTSLPYSTGISMSKLLYSLLLNCSANLVLKLPLSVLATRGYRALWWSSFVPNYCLVLDPLIYEGYSRPSINSEVILVWIRDVVVETTLMYNLATLK